MCTGTMTQKMDTPFACKGDPYSGVTVSADVIGGCASAKDFGAQLEASVAAWQRDGKRGAWLEVPAGKTLFIGRALRQGFTIHHAEPKYVMLVRWLPGGESPLPPNASHTVGVGIVCVNERDEICLVQEATGPAAARRVSGGFWKVPTGLVTQGEDLATAAEREMEEETGVEARFERVSAIGELHRTLHGKSNLFVVCVLRAPSAARELKPQASEISAARWMPADEFLALPYYKPGTLHAELYRTALADARRGDGAGFGRERLALGFRRGEAACYRPAASFSRL